MNVYKKRSLSIRNGLILLFLAMSLTSCARILFPKEFFDPCKVTYLKDGDATVGDVVVLAEDRRGDTLKCDADKGAIKSFILAHPKLGIK